MILTYNECINKYEGVSRFRKALKNGDLCKIEKNYYSDKKYEPELALIARKFPNAVLTLNSAFYYQGLTDTIPDHYYLATDKDALKIRDQRVKQSFDNSGQLLLGSEQAEVDGADVRMYNKERLFIEAVRNRSKLPFDYYKEIINSYRGIVHELDIQAIEEYADLLPKTALVKNTLRMEVL